MKQFSNFLKEAPLQEVSPSIESGNMKIPDLLKVYNDQTIPWVIWDTETTGLNPVSPTAQIIEIAAYKIEFGTQRGSEKVEYFHEKSLLRKEVIAKQAEEREWLKTNAPGPHYKSIDDLLKMTQYNRKDYVDPQSKKSYNVPYVPYKKMIADFMQFLEHKTKILLVAHNQSFDVGQLKAALAKNKMPDLPVDRYVLLDSLALGRVYFFPLVQRIAEIGKGSDKASAQKIIEIMTVDDKVSHKLGIYMNVFADAIRKVSAEAGADHHSALFDSFNLSIVAAELLMFLERNQQYADDTYYNEVKSNAARIYKKRNK